MQLKTANRLFPGLALVTGVSALATLLGHVLPLFGGAACALALGIALRWRFSPGAAYDAGIRFAARQVLQWSIVALGFGLPLAQVMRAGMDSLSVTLATVAVAWWEGELDRDKLKKALSRNIDPSDIETALTTGAENPAKG